MALVALISAGIVVAAVLFQFGLHSIDEGHVGVYWRGGALLKTITRPGFHWRVPFLTQMYPIQTTVQTDSIKNIPCGTSGGTMIHFDKVEVVNQLSQAHVYETVKNYTVNYDQTWIFDKIHHEINQFCSKHTLQEVYIDLFDTLDESLQLALQQDCDKWAPGIAIIAVRVTKVRLPHTHTLSLSSFHCRSIEQCERYLSQFESSLTLTRCPFLRSCVFKPKIPEVIRRNYEAMEAEKTKLLIETQRQKVVEKSAETERKRATIEAQQQKDVSEIQMRRKLAEQKTEQEIATMINEMHVATEKAYADAAHYKRLQEAEANALLLTPAYIEMKRIQSLANNTKVFFGNSIPSMFAMPSAVSEA